MAGYFRYFLLVFWAVFCGSLQAADLAVQISVTQSELEKGDQTTVNIRLLNQDGAAVNGVKIQITVVPGLAIQSPMTTKGVFDPASQLWTIDKIADTKTNLELQFKVLVKGDGPLAIKAEIMAQDKPDPDSAPGNGKMGEDDMAFTFVTVPVVFCGAEKVDLTAEAFPGFTNYQWLHNGQVIPGATDRKLHVLEVGRYTCQVSENKYALVTSFPLIVKQAPALEVELGDAKQVCVGDKLFVTARAAAGTPPFRYEWSNNLNKSLDTAFKAGTNLRLEVLVTDKAGCKAKDNVLVQVMDCH